MRLPEFLRKLSPLRETLDAIEAGAARLEEEVQGKNRQVHISTATEGLRFWENDYHLSSGGDMEARRGRIRTAIEGEQTLTRKRLASLAQELANADESEVEEFFDQYLVHLTALYDERSPEELTVLREALERLQPAHLRLELEAAERLRHTLPRWQDLTGAVYLELYSEEGEQQ